jgi:type II secretory pathway pseudopilin PulG
MLWLFKARQGCLCALYGPRPASSTIGPPAAFTVGRKKSVTAPGHGEHIENAAPAEGADMTTTATAPTTTSTATARRWTRIAAIAGTSITVGLTFAVAHPLGVDFVITDPGPAQPPHAFSMPELMILTAVIGLLGWGTLAVLERFTKHGRVIWAVLGAAILVLSYVPITFEVATIGTKIMLAVIHTLVAAGLFIMLRRRS